MTNKIIKKQKQKQKQKQTVIVNINNEKAKPARRRKPIAPQQKQAASSTIIPPPLYYPPSFNHPSQNNKNTNEIRDLLLQLSKGEKQPEPAIITRPIAGTRPNLQHELVLDKQEEAAQLPNRPPRNMTENDAALLRMRSQLNHDAPFVFSRSAEETDDLHMIQSKLVAPQTPLNAVMGQLSEHHMPIMNQPPPTIHIEVGTSGTDAIGEVDLDTVEEETPTKGHAADAQYLLDFIDTLDKTRPPPRFTGILATPERAPTLAEKAGLPEAESRFTSPEPPEAHASPAVVNVEAEAVDRENTKKRKEAGFHSVNEVKDAVRNWNSWNRDPNKHIQLSHSTKNGGTGGQKDIADFEQDFGQLGMTLKGLKEFHDENPNSPNITRGGGGGGGGGGSKVKQIKKGTPLGSPLGVNEGEI